MAARTYVVLSTVRDPKEDFDHEIFAASFENRSGKEVFYKGISMPKRGGEKTPAMTPGRLRYLERYFGKPEPLLARMKKALDRIDAEKEVRKSRGEKVPVKKKAPADKPSAGFEPDIDLVTEEGFDMFVSLCESGLAATTAWKMAFKKHAVKKVKKGKATRKTGGKTPAAAT